MSVIRRHQCHFAVLGGGMSPFYGASNADGGITIDMGRMKDIAFVDEANLHLKVSAGSIWANVYRALESFNMSATGTRNSLTGVIGSILGGGMSFFSEHHGWACDTVVEFEVVLANSTIAKANRDKNFDLFGHLRAVATVFRDPPQWYTFQLFHIDDRATVFKRLENRAAAMPPHVWQVAMTFQWHVPTDHFVISERMVASEQPDLPESLIRVNGHNDRERSPVLQTYVVQKSILAMAQKMDGMNGPGFFNFFGSVTVRSNAEVSMAMAEVFEEEIELIKGGNALGIVEEDGPLTVVNINLHWSEERSESRMRHFMRRLIKRFRKTAEHLDMLHPYIFQNHAFEEQDVFAGSGEENLARLKAIRKALDPHDVFQRLQPGYFKLEPGYGDEEGAKEAERGGVDEERRAFGGKGE
ncbi:MAG: hypothetical protein M1822_008376 [Bathelium mastoideum]|nr:MAG: hypothetical protein M1822_008376 [Bathelium mastoideum]